MQDFATPQLWLALALGGTALLGLIAGFFLRGWHDARRRARPGSGADQPAAFATQPRLTRATVAAQPATRSTPRPQASVAAADRTSATLGWAEPDGPTVLLVDDRPELLALHGACLHKHGYRVLMAEDGLTGLEYARTHQPGVIVLDHSMPGRTGIDVARDLKRDPRTAHIPVLLMTAHSYGAVGAAAREAGCDAFLPKPVDPSRLLREVVVHMRQGSPHS